MAEIVWLNNGQGEFDFDYLLNLTDQNFCDYFSSRLSGLEEISNVKAIKVENNVSVTVQVTVVTNGGIVVFQYWKDNGRCDSVTIGGIDLSWIMEVMKNGER